MTTFAARSGPPDADELMISFGLFRRAVETRATGRLPGAERTGPCHTELDVPQGDLQVPRRRRGRRWSGISLTADYWRKNARGKTLARNYRESLERYFVLDAADGRAATTQGSSRR